MQRHTNIDKGNLPEDRVFGIFFIALLMIFGGAMMLGLIYIGYQGLVNGRF